jgi:hypothetical protein
VQQAKDQLAAGERWTETGLVFTTRLGTGMNAANVRRDLRRALALVPGLDPADWTPRELRHSFVSLLSDAGVPLGDIAQLVGHSGTTGKSAMLALPVQAVNLKWAAQNDIITLDPHSQNHATTNAVMQHTYEGLTRYTRDYKLEPALATVWNGENGVTILYQNELPYDPPTQADWMHDGVEGWAGYKVGDGVRTHTLQGGGVYVFNRNNPSIHTENGFEVPERPGVRFLALSVSDAAEDVIAVIRAGARGYVTKSISPADLADALRRFIAAGRPSWDATSVRVARCFIAISA